MTAKARILIVDDEKDIRFLIREILEDEGYEVSEAPHSESALSQFSKTSHDLVILDIWLQNSDMDGMEILAEINKRNPAIPILMISGHGNIELAVKAIKLGAYDFIEKPFHTDRLLLMVTRALEQTRLKTQNSHLIRQTGQGAAQQPATALFTHVSADVARQAQKAAQSDARLLISGAWGSGRTYLARWVHQNSVRADRLLSVLSCRIATAPEISRALHDPATGTLVLQDVEFLSPEGQGVLRAALAQSAAEKPIVRIIATLDPSSGQNLSSDLRDRLGVLQLHMPRLRDHRADVPPLFTKLVSQWLTRWHLPDSVQLLEQTDIWLRQHDWPGEIQELKSLAGLVAVQLAVTGNRNIMLSHVAVSQAGQSGSVKRDGPDTQAWLSQDLRQAREAFEKWYFDSQLQRFSGNISQMAGFVGMDRTALHRKLKNLNRDSGREETSDDEHDDAPDDTDPERLAS